MLTSDSTVCSRIEKCSITGTHYNIDDRFQFLQWRPNTQSPFGSHSVVWSDVDGVGGRVVADGQPQVGDAARPVLLHQDVLGLQVSVRDTWLSYQNINVHFRHFSIHISKLLFEHVIVNSKLSFMKN